MRFKRTYEITEQEFTVEFEVGGLVFNHGPLVPWSEVELEDFDVTVINFEPAEDHPFAREIVRERLIDKIKDDDFVFSCLEDAAAVEARERGQN
jgi:hypothetical protein